MFCFMFLLVHLVLGGCGVSWSVSPRCLAGEAAARKGKNESSFGRGGRGGRDELRVLSTGHGTCGARLERWTRSRWAQLSELLGAQEQSAELSLMWDVPSVRVCPRQWGRWSCAPAAPLLQRCRRRIL